MTQDRRNADFRNLQDAAISRVRRGDERPPDAMGYSPGGDALRAKAVPGDQKFPFFKDVPDVEGPFRLTSAVKTDGGKPPVVANPIPTAPFASPDWRAALASTELIDVRGVRLLNLVVLYYPSSQNVVGDLILIPDAVFATPPEAAPGALSPTPIGVVDPTLTTPGTFPQGFARRRTYASEFNFSAGAVLALDTDGPATETLVFDVAPYNEIRFYYGEGTPGGISGLELYFLLER